MQHETTLLVLLATSFGVAFLLGMLARRLRLPPLVGYLLAGIAVGPFTPGFVGDVDLARELAEVGVILLMFGVGLHFSPRDLLAVRSISLPGAVVQIIAATAMGALLVRAWGWSWGAGLVFGLALSVASTVVLLRALEERDALASTDGRIAVGWLIVEDLAMVLALVLLPELAGGADDGATRGLLLALGATLVKVLGFFVFMFVIGRRVIPWLLIRVARTGNRELFTLAVLAIAVGIAVGAAELFAVSFALGAFFAGVVVGESDISHQAAAEALPLQDAFAVLFFVSVGMLFDPRILVEQPLHVLSVVLIIMFGKSLAAFAIVLAFRYPLRTALVVAASLAQIGEFSFILAMLGNSLGMLPPEGTSLLLAGSLLSITLNPLVFATIDPVERLFKALPRLGAWLERPAGALADLPPLVEASELRDHVVLIGHGRVGGLVAAALQRLDLSYVIVEQNRQTVEALRRRDLPALYGDATRPAILEHTHLERARLLVVATPDPLQARFIVELATRVNPELDIVVRTDSEHERDFLERAGVSKAVVGERELALGMVRHTLAFLGRSDELPSISARMLRRLRDSSIRASR